MKLADKDHPFYRPLWRRIVIVAIVAAWVCFEVLVEQNPFWMMISGALLAYAVWTFLIGWPQQDEDKS